jgi:RNA polymerase sigma factor (sigma-70 family)
MNRHPPPSSARPRTLEALFGSLFATHRAALLRMLRRRGVPAGDLEDLAAEVWIDVHRRLPEHAADFGAIEDPREFAARTCAWVITFGRHRAMRWRRDLNRRREDLGNTALEDPPDDRLSLEDALQRRSLCARVRVAVARVPDARHRALLEALYVEERTQADTAHALGWDESRLRRQLAEARLALRRGLLQLRVPS